MTGIDNEQTCKLAISSPLGLPGNSNPEDLGHTGMPIAVFSDLSAKATSCREGADLLAAGLQKALKQGHAQFRKRSRDSNIRRKKAIPARIVNSVSSVVQS